MKYDPDKHHRRLGSKPSHPNGCPKEYTCGYTLRDRSDYQDTITANQMRLNQYGAIVADEWQKSSIIRREIELDEWVVMPNHFHGIVMITNDCVGANGDAKREKALAGEPRLSLLSKKLIL